MSKRAIAICTAVVITANSLLLVPCKRQEVKEIQEVREVQKTPEVITPKQEEVKPQQSQPKKIPEQPKQEKPKAQQPVSRGNDGLATNDGIKLSPEDYELLARLVHAEAGSESIQSQIGVVNVVLNRVRSSEFPNSIRAVIYQKYQFSPVANGSINKPATKKNYEAVKRAIAGESSVGDCVYFWADYVDKNNSLWNMKVRYKYDGTVFAGHIKRKVKY